MTCLNVKNGSFVKSFLTILCVLLVQSSIHSQVVNEDLLSVSNRKAFGDFLFCDQDFLRAIDEYKYVLNKIENDTLQYKIGLSYFYMNQFDFAQSSFQILFNNTSFADDAKLEYFRSGYYIEKHSDFRVQVAEGQYVPKTYSKSLIQLSNYSHLLDDSTLPEELEFLNNFESQDQKKIKEFYFWKKDPPYKSPTKGAILSALIPGLGKVYANEIGDGITGFLLTGLFTYLAIDKFQKDQTTSAWLFTAAAVFFYGGNIYGSATAVQNYNASIKFSFDNEVKLYLNNRNHFLPPPKYLCE